MYMHENPWNEKSNLIGKFGIQRHTSLCLFIWNTVSLHSFRCFCWCCCYSFDNIQWFIRRSSDVCCLFNRSFRFIQINLFLITCDALLFMSCNCCFMSVYKIYDKVLGDTNWFMINRFKHFERLVINWFWVFDVHAYFMWAADKNKRSYRYFFAMFAFSVDISFQPSGAVGAHRDAGRAITLIMITFVGHYFFSKFRSSISLLKAQTRIFCFLYRIQQKKSVRRRSFNFLLCFCCSRKSAILSHGSAAVAYGSWAKWLYIHGSWFLR